MVKIYLAHPGQPSVIKRAKKFQRRLEQMGFEVINPFDQNEYARKLTEQWRKGKQDYEQASLIFSNDLDSVNKSDMVVAYFPNVWSWHTDGNVPCLYAGKRGLCIFKDDFSLAYDSFRRKSFQ